MALNPSKRQEPIESPVVRKNTVNDPGFSEKLGYYPYDLTHIEILTPLFGKITPSFHLLTTLGDRHVLHDDTKTILEKIPGNFLNTVNQYNDSFFVSNRTLFPNNWDKLIPNPVKGDDLRPSALPMVPLMEYFHRLLYDDSKEIDLLPSSDTDDYYVRGFVGSLIPDFINELRDGTYSYTKDETALLLNFILGRVSFYAHILSRGELLDYLGFQFDRVRSSADGYTVSLQYLIDRFFQAYCDFILDQNYVTRVRSIKLDPTSDKYIYGVENKADDVFPFLTLKTKSQFRHFYTTVFERGNMPWYDFDDSFLSDLTEYQIRGKFEPLFNAIDNLINSGLTNMQKTIDELDSSPDPFGDGYSFNISKVLAYQLCVAHYFSNDSVDNIFTSDLYMQLLRGCMFPSYNGFSSEPTFDYNGVPSEYDYISYGGFYNSLCNSSNSVLQNGCTARHIIVGSLLFMMRNSLRYGDYFTTARPRMLAVGQLSIPVDPDGVSVNPVDVTIGLVVQRYLNAGNRIGNKPIAYYASIYGIEPSDVGAIPRYIGHRKIELENRITINTAGDQGTPTTNLVGYSDKTAMDVFIDDFGVILSLQSYDVLPIYNSGIDSDNRLADRFDYFNPMMQNIGDQPIRLSELYGYPQHYETVFGYTVRNSEYKYKIPRAHGVASYGLKGYIMRYPLWAVINQSDFRNMHIDPEFIRDAPFFLDDSIPENTGVSPGEYYHFVVSVVNEVKSARLIQKAPSILF